MPLKIFCSNTMNPYSPDKNGAMNVRTMYSIAQPFLYFKHLFAFFQYLATEKNDFFCHFIVQLITAACQSYPLTAPKYSII